jgi:hypothetical protein
MNEKTTPSPSRDAKSLAPAPRQYTTPPTPPPSSQTTPPVEASALAPAARHDWHRILLFAAVIVATGLFVASPAFHGTWLWDDDQEITANPALNSGFAGLREIWKGNVGADYLPLKATILWTEWQIWQYDNTCYHIINAFWHVVCALLLWRLFSLLRIRWAWIGGLLFAIHPVLVESVAWVSEQKNTISMIFMLLSAITYIKHHEGGKPCNLVISLAMFVAALLSKSAVIMLPFCFVLYAWWRDNKFEARDLLLLLAVAGAMIATLGLGWAISRRSINYLMLMLAGGVVSSLFVYLWWIIKRGEWKYVWKFALTALPYFVIVALVAVVTVHFQHKNAIGAEVIPVGGIWSRIVIAGAAVFFYLKQCVWPFAPYELIPIYPRWEVPENPPFWMFLPWVIFAALVCLFWVYRRTWGRHMIFGLGFFFGFLVPVLGFVDMSYMRITWVADHFLYIPVIGVIGLLVAGAAKVYDGLAPRGKPWAMGAGVAGLALISLNANLYSDVFLNETNMWRYTLSKNPNAWQAHSRYGKVLLDSGNRDAAFYHIQQSNRLRPDLAETNNNMGVLLQEKGRQAEAIPYFGRAVRLMPIGAFLFNYANMLTTAQQGATAAPVYEKLLRSTGGPFLAKILRDRGVQALEKLFAERGGATLGDLIREPGGEALGKLLRKKCGDSYERVLGLRGAAAVEELIKLHVSEAFDDYLKAQSVETLEKLVGKEGGEGLEKRLRDRGILDDLLKLAGGDELALVLKKKGSDAYLSFRGLRGSDAYESMIMTMRDDPLEAMLKMPGGEQLAQLLKSGSGDSIIKLHRMDGTEAQGVLAEMLGGDPIAHLTGMEGGDPRFWTNYGIALMQANRRDDAIPALQKALKINPNLADARRNLEIAQGASQPQPAIRQDLSFPMSNLPGTAGVPLQIPSIFLNK